jgi:hypothetical protein
MSVKNRILKEILDSVEAVVREHNRSHFLSKALLLEIEKRHRLVTDAITRSVEEKREVVIRQKDQELLTISKEHESLMRDVREHYERSKKEALDKLATVLSTRWSELSFEHEGWTRFAPANDAVISRFVRIGSLELKLADGSVQLPALLPLLGVNNLFIRASGAAKKTANDAMQCIMLRLLASLPPGDLKFMLVDPVGLGANMAGFMHLPKELIGGKAWTEANHIEQRLADLSEHMETVIQKYLKNRYGSMEEYNKKAGEVAEPYRLLMVSNFPVNFTESSARRLINVASNGPKTGVHVIATIDKNQPVPYGFRIEDLERTGIVIDFDKDRFVWRDEDFGKCNLYLDALPSNEIFNLVIEAISEGTKQLKNVEVPFEKFLLDQEKWWRSDSRTGLVAPIGKSGADEVVNFDLGRGTAHHALLSGRVGSGKSNLLHVIITSLAIRYSPREIELYLVDFKKGVEFKDYATHRLPHAKVIAIQSEREFGISVLERLDKELQRRGDLFRAKGVSSIQEFREKMPDIAAPRILLLVDEYQEFFAQDDYYARTAALILDRLVRQGRAFGMHVLLASQALAGTYNISRSTTDQMAVRIALQSSEADSRLILGGENPAARLLSRPGEAIYNAGNGAIEDNVLFQVFLLDEEVRKRLLRQLNDRLDHEIDVKRTMPIIFEGDAPAEIASNQELTSLLESRQSLADTKEFKGWLGEPISIKSHTCAVFRRQSRSNLLIIGQNEEASIAMVMSSLISLFAHSKNSEFDVINLSTADTHWQNKPNLLSSVLSHSIRIVGRRNIGNVITNAADVIRKRLDKPDSSSITAKLFLVFIGLQRARDLRSIDGYSPSDGAVELSFVLREGPDVGVHTIMWCDTVANFERVFERRMLSEFDLRVALRMSAEESHTLIDSDQASKLEGHRAILYDEEKTGRLEKFRPYALPSDEYIKDSSALLKRSQRS